jgi:ubiquinone/menaquinone biosynthesis C-methylase UbiE
MQSNFFYPKLNKRNIKYIVFLIMPILIISLSLKAQNMSIFSKATKSGWYPQFLNPVVEAITRNSQNHTILDIGTGPGTLPEMLIMKDSGLKITGIDIDSTMIDEAKSRLSHLNVSFQNQKVNAPLQFVNEQFDVVTFCSVLFLLDDTIKTGLMNEAVRVLKANGRIIILTPSGKKPILSAFIEVWRYKFSFNNFTFPIWKIATTRGGRKWQRQKWLESYAMVNHLNYSCSLTFNNNATIEIISIK